LRVLEALFEQGIDDSQEDIAKKAGVSVRQLRRYWKDEAFIIHYEALIDERLRRASMPMVAALIKGGMDTNCRGHATNQRTFWQMRNRLVNANTNKVQIQDPDKILAETLGVPIWMLPGNESGELSASLPDIEAMTKAPGGLDDERRHALAARLRRVLGLLERDGGRVGAGLGGELDMAALLEDLADTGMDSERED